MSMQLNEVHMRSKIGHGGVRMNMPAQSESKEISSRKLHQRAQTLSGKQDFQEHLMNDWLQAQSKIPCSICATFRENGYSNPSIDNDGLPAFILQREFRSIKNSDPEEKHQKAIPISVIRELVHRDGTDLE